MPEYDRESGDKRLFDHIVDLQAGGWEVHFYAQRGETDHRYSRKLQQMGIPTYTGPELWTRLLESTSFDLALLMFWHMADAYAQDIRRLSPHTRVVVDSIDVHFLREARRVFLSKTDAALDINYASLTAREINAYAAADAVLTVSQKEADLIGDMVADPRLAFCVPDSEELAPSRVPFAKRNGLLFIGNFNHIPNVEAATYLCEEILPRLDKESRDAHPVTIIGNAMPSSVTKMARSLESVTALGWVPSVVPYLQRARATVAPILHGAGTKRKLIQALMIGTPAVTTTIGTEGLGLVHEEHVLVADDPVAFVGAIERLVSDPRLWSVLSRNGRRYIASLHGRERVGKRLISVLEEVLEKDPKPAMKRDSALELHGHAVDENYKDLTDRIRLGVETLIPDGSVVSVVNKGDEKLRELGGKIGWHFPRGDDGEYLGYYPYDTTDAIDQIEKARRQGSHYLLIPEIYSWWFEHYEGLEEYLDSNYRLVWRQPRTAAIYELEPSSPKDAIPPIPPRSVSSLRKQPEPKAAPTRTNQRTGGEVLVVGICLADIPNSADHIVRTISAAAVYKPDQRWVVLGEEPVSEVLSNVSQRQKKAPKFEILNRLLGDIDLTRYEYAVLIDDDIVVPDNFLDDFLSTQDELGWVIAQPARTENSYIDHPIVQRQPGVRARRTLFVEIGPVVSFHRSIFNLVFPFDLSSDMGWGYENVWSYRLAELGLPMGIVDSVAVDHSLRKPVENYSWDKADLQRSEYLLRTPHHTYDECFKVLEVVPLEERSAR